MVYAFFVFSAVGTGVLVATLAKVMGVDHTGILVATGIIGAAIHTVVVLGWYLHHTRAQPPESEASDESL